MKYNKDKDKNKNNKKNKGVENIEFLKLLVKYRKNPNQFKKLIQNSTNSELDSITEIIFNYLQGTLNLNKAKFKRHADFLRLIGDKHQSFKNRRKYILKKGSGILVPLISMAIPVLLNMISK